MTYPLQLLTCKNTYQCCATVETTTLGPYKQCRVEVLYETWRGPRGPRTLLCRGRTGVVPCTSGAAGCALACEDGVCSGVTTGFSKCGSGSEAGFKDGVEAAVEVVAASEAVSKSFWRAWWAWLMPGESILGGGAGASDMRTGVGVVMLAIMSGCSMPELVSGV